MSHEVFISYSVKDKPIADALCHQIEAESIRCWVAPRDIRPGSIWASEIANSIPKSKIMLLIFSSNSNSSEQVLREVELAVKHKVIIVPFKIEDVMPSGGMAYYLSTTHWIDAVGKSLNKKTIILIDTLKNFLYEPENVEEKKYLDKNAIQTIPTSKSTKNDSKNSKRKWFYIFIPIGLVLLLVLGYLSFTIWFPDLLKSNSENVFSPTPTISQTISLTYSPEKFGYNPEHSAEIYDPKLKECIKLTLEADGQTVGDDITIGDMFKLENLVIVSDSIEQPVYDLKDISDLHIISENGISHLWGLEYAKNLRVLVIEGNDLIDIASISELTQLEYLSLNSNEIVSIDAITNLTLLKAIWLCNNNIAYIQPIGNLLSLTEIDLGYNNISDITYLENIVNLKELVLTGNPLSDLSPLSNLPDLFRLTINQIDFTKIVGLNKLHTITYLHITHSNLSDLSQIKELTQLEGLYINNNNLENVDALNGLINLETLSINENNIAIFPSLENLKSLRYLVVDENTYNDNLSIMKILEENGCTITKEKASIILFTPEHFGYSSAEIINFKNQDLENSLKEIFEKTGDAADSKITIGDMFNLKTLILHPAGTTVDVTAFEGWPQIQPVSIAECDSLSDLSNLSYAMNLYVLILDGFEIEDLSPLSNLPNLSYLSLQGNSILDIGAIEELQNLSVLYLDNNYIEDISALSSLENLGWLGLSRNYITDLSPLDTLQKLGFLNIDKTTYSQNTETLNILLDTGCQISTPGT